MPRKPGQVWDTRKSCTFETCIGADYSDEEREWLVAMDRLKRRLGRHPAYPEVLAEAIRLGYRRVE